MRLHKPQLPTFEHFKETYSDPNYSMVMPGYKESKTVYDGNKIGSVYAHGLGWTAENILSHFKLTGDMIYSTPSPEIGYRYYNYWMGCKYFTDIDADYTINTDEVNYILKQLP